MPCSHRWQVAALLCLSIMCCPDRALVARADCDFGPYLGPFPPTSRCIMARNHTIYLPSNAATSPVMVVLERISGWIIPVSLRYLAHSALSMVANNIASQRRLLLTLDKFGNSTDPLCKLTLSWLPPSVSAQSRPLAEDVYTPPISSAASDVLHSMLLYGIGCDVVQRVPESILMYTSL